MWPPSEGYTPPRSRDPSGASRALFLRTKPKKAKQTGMPRRRASRKGSRVRSNRRASRKGSRVRSNRRTSRRSRPSGRGRTRRSRNTFRATTLCDGTHWRFLWREDDFNDIYIRQNGDCFTRAVNDCGTGSRDGKSLTMLGDTPVLAIGTDEYFRVTRYSYRNEACTEHLPYATLLTSALRKFKENKDIPLEDKRTFRLLMAPNEQTGQQDAYNFLSKLTLHCVEFFGDGEFQLFTIFDYQEKPLDELVTDWNFHNNTRGFAILNSQIQGEMTFPKTVTIGDNVLFQLIGTVTHSSDANRNQAKSAEALSIESGHYIAKVRRGENVWHEINDSVTEEITYDVSEELPRIIFYHKDLPDTDLMVQGLSNHGDDCFMNAVLQNLLPFLHEQ